MSAFAWPNKPEDILHGPLERNSFERNVDVVLGAIKDEITARLGRLLKLCESPIERHLLIAIYPMEALQWVGTYTVRVIPQQWVGRYRIDIAVYVYCAGEVVGRIAVECDGHNFHERTPEQALRDRKRDRELTLAGWKPLRFTGREIMRAPLHCFMDVFNLVDAMSGPPEQPNLGVSNAHK